MRSHLDYDIIAMIYLYLGEMDKPWIELRESNGCIISRAILDCLDEDFGVFCRMKRGKRLGYVITKKPEWITLGNIRLEDQR